jgi:ABC-type Fe3+ transport system substrate-binding protein
MLRLLALAAAVAIAAPAAFAADFPPELQKVIEGAKKEGKLAVSTSASLFNAGQGAAFAAEHMNKMFGTKIEVTWAPGPHPAQIGAKLMGEFQANQPAFTDILLGTPSQFAPLLKAGLFREVPWAKMMPERVKPQFVESQGRALRVYTSVPAILWHQNHAAQAEKVTSLQDFLKPEWKGKFFSTAQASVFDVLTSEQVWGEKRVTEYVTKLGPQAAGLIECGAGDRIASGEVPVFVIDCSGNDIYTPKYNGAIKGKVLQDFAQLRHGYMGVPKNAAHPNAAMLYTLWWATPEANAYNWSVRGIDMADYPESKRRANVIEPLLKQGVKFTEVTIEWWENQKGLDQSFRRVVKALNESASK